MKGLPKFVPEEKEALSLINGATLTSALAAAAVHRAQRVLRAAEVACAMSMEAGLADLRCLDLDGLQARGHRGAVEVASHLHALLKGSALCTAGREPDSFSTRCAPAVLGAAAEAIDHVAAIVDRELNGACDNPLVMEDREIELGNFHGAPVALAMDYLKIALTQVAGISERRVFRLTYGHLARGLPSFLIEGTGVNSGFMLAQYTAASLVSACKGLAHPGSVDSIPTIQHHEDHVSMGPISARMCLKLLENVADVVAIEALVAAQALDFRRAGVRFEPSGERVQGHPVELASGVSEAHAIMRISLPHWEQDRVLHPELRSAGRIVRSGALGSVAGAGLLGPPW
jgi:histidine ammonia-lyase